jgi:hypothetical protein
MISFLVTLCVIAGKYTSTVKDEMFASGAKSQPERKRIFGFRRNRAAGRGYSGAGSEMLLRPGANQI